MVKFMKHMKFVKKGREEICRNEGKEVTKRGDAVKQRAMRERRRKRWRGNGGQIEREWSGNGEEMEGEWGGKKKAVQIKKLSQT